MRGGVQPRRPVRPRARPTGGNLGEGGIHILGNLERRMAPAEPLARRRDLGGAERRAVHVVPALLRRRAIADHRPAGDHRRPVRAPRHRDRRGDPVGVVPVDLQHPPAAGAKAHRLVDRGRQPDVAVDGDPVVVPEHDEPPEPQVPGEVDRLLADPFHQAAVAGDHPGEMVDEPREPRRLHPLGERHPDRRRDPLPERPGRHLDPERVAVLRMPGGPAAELPERLQLVHPHVGIAEQVVQRIEQHRPVPGRQHEPVAVRPLRIGRIELDEAVEQHRRDIRHAHRHPRMPRLRRLHRVHGERPDGVRHRRLARQRHLPVHAPPPFEDRFLMSTSRRISGVRISCIARSSLLPGITIEFARLIHEPWIIETR